MPQHLQIAIDGPAGAGKSTVAKSVAAKLGLLYLDTGAMYRAVAYKVLQRGIPLEDETAISEIVKSTRLEIDRVDNKVFCDGEDVTAAIRTPEVTNAVSIIARYQNVRKVLVQLQREVAERTGVVMDGRDIGTNVLPEAQLKIFLTASPEERARRRFLELREKGTETSLAQVQQDLEARDLRDQNRDLAPLKPASDAIIIDTTNLSVEEIVDKIVALSQEVAK